MAKYRLDEFDGVVHVATGRSIPAEPKNEHWREYLKWAAQGFAPDPAPAPKPKTDEDLLNESDQRWLRSLDWLFQYLVHSGALPLADIPAPVKELYLQRKALRGE